MLGIAEVPEQFKVDACICDRKKSWQKVFNLELEKRLNRWQSDRQALLQKLGYRRDFGHELSFVFKCGIFRVVLDRAFEQREPLFLTFVIVKPLWIPRYEHFSTSRKSSEEFDYLVFWMYLLRLQSATSNGDFNSWSALDITSVMQVEWGTLSPTHPLAIISFSLALISGLTALNVW